MLKIFIGADSRQPVAYYVLEHSILRHASEPVAITRLDLNKLPITKKGLTEFTYSRYLVPWLCGYKGTAIFLDADMVVKGDICELAQYSKHSVSVAPVEKFERPSVMVFNCAMCKKLTPEYIENEVPQRLEDWCTTGLGEIPAEWNHIVPYSGERRDPKLIHYTQGIPVWDETEDCEHADEWHKNFQQMISTTTWQDLMGGSVHASRMGLKAEVPEGASPPRVLFIHRGGPEMASYRYRTQIPAEQTDSVINEGAGRIFVFSKPMQEDLELARRLKGESSVKVVVDFCDDHFDGEFASLYLEMLELADHVVCPTAQMRSIIHEHRYEVPVTVIPDPYEFDEHDPHANGQKMLWFGHQTNIEKAYPAIKELGADVCSGPSSVTTHLYENPENFERLSLEYNIALFPSSEAYKSPNRLINALRLGMFPLCADHPSYREFRDFAWVGLLKDGKEWVKDNQAELNSLVKQGQDYIRDKYSPEAIGKQWQALFDSI